jgi:hypothetical protein
MGCDIHSVAEVKVGESKYGEEFWEKAKCQFNSGYDNKAVDEPIYQRNYDLFAILADVRNGCGFAGVKTGSGFEPITNPRGIPEDACTVIKAMCWDYGSDGHSHSHITLKELLEYDWKGQKTLHQGYVSLEVYKQFKETGNPYPYSGGVGGRSVIHVDNDEMDKLIKNDSFVEGKQYYTLIEWEATYYDSCKHFVDITIPELEKLGKPEDVRIVFFFDN